ncbi:hypothetical protein GYMLUDRAFT_250100 [Collybiopsis luxurians FD-317 M1]|uniref:Hydrophobin n=1 Tax=Collybiopsis luxurians FD-317 M1 TaxID=944289 RepID=A0A0D0BVS8_9AGAR|nr:hypothetical protein GYMLUDRAFT_250100 [Collybiopsis luxurians FD-317 M1]
MQFKLAFVTAVFATLAVATPSPRGEPASTCSTGPVQCCDTLATAQDPAAAAALGLVGVVLQDVNIPVGLNCDPITVIGAGLTTCNAQAVCCEDNSHDKLADSLSSATFQEASFPLVASPSLFNFPETLLFCQSFIIRSESLEYTYSVSSFVYPSRVSVTSTTFDLHLDCSSAFYSKFKFAPSSKEIRLVTASSRSPIRSSPAPFRGFSHTALSGGSHSLVQKPRKEDFSLFTIHETG